jgi:hypothetical protein
LTVLVLIGVAAIVFAAVGASRRPQKPAPPQIDASQPPPAKRTPPPPAVAERAAYALGVARDLEQSKMLYAAAKAYQEIVRRFPTTAEADMAKVRLEALRPKLKTLD